ncbi:DNA repair protein RadC [Marinilactibacillus psychrotolerans]|uniref:DNA repair protein RadC n=1 Tax=Marinilactibacillus psychrotolerans TaxID=191770 RepID=A0ABW8UKZ3_9LACT|nr:DNA repair protein RadC [Marinilactibacillus psychrotolerans]GEQ33944.1 DNA repair protein RadC [Marinilactibacillus psychrotolerans]
MKVTTQKFSDVPEQSRPRERLTEYGAKALANHELLAILLRTGTREMNVLQLSMKVLSEFDNLFMLRHVTVEELVSIEGIGNAKAIEMIAAIEFGNRVARASQIKEGTVTSSSFVGTLLQEELGGLQQEHVMALYLNTKNEIIKKEIVFKGSLNSSVAHPREIYRGAVKYAAARIIIAHNHPSGNPEPSEADLSFTKRMTKAGEMIGIELLDHIIIGENTYVSLKEYGII